MEGRNRNKMCNKRDCQEHAREGHIHRKKEPWKDAVLFLGLLLLLAGCAGKTGDVPGADTQAPPAMARGAEQPGLVPEGNGQDMCGEGQGEDPEDAGMDSALQELEIHFLDVGQGDCTLVTCGGESLLIDAGDNEQGIKVQNYLQKQGIDFLDYVLCTHPDADHIGGIDVVLYKFDCGTLFMTGEERDTKTYRDVAEVMKEKGCQKTLPVVGDQYTLGDATFTMVGPYREDETGNNNSIAILLAHGENTFLFTGDAEEEEELDMLFGDTPLSADVYKAGHHGSSTSSCQEFLDAVQPAYVVISCGVDNSYGHPHAESMNRFRAMGVQIFRTDEQGTVMVTSNGKELTWNCSPSDTWQAGEPTGGTGAGGSSGESQEAGPADGTQDMEGDSQGEAMLYICNVGSRKFHYPDCSSVEQMSEKNKLTVTATREELIGQGYEPCGSCKP